jgi:hypothetical protein
MFVIPITQEEEIRGPCSKIGWGKAWDPIRKQTKK